MHPKYKTSTQNAIESIQIQRCMHPNIKQAPNYIKNTPKICKNTPTYNNESIRSSYGFGIKFYTPIGPIGLNWAFPINSESYDIERMFLFSIGNLN